MAEEAPIYNVTEAKALAAELLEGAKDLGNTLATKAKAAARELDTYAGFKKLLDGAPSEEDRQLIAAHLEIAAEETPKAEDLKKIVNFKLSEEVERVKKSPFHNAITKNQDAAKAIAAKEVEKEVEKDGFLKRTFGSGKLNTALEEHSKKMDARTKGERLGISIGQVGLGFVGINVGSSMLQQAVSGVKRKKEFAEDSQGNRQLAAITAIPVGAGERTFKAATGAVITAAGIGSFMLGATNFSKSL